MLSRVTPANRPKPNRVPTLRPPRQTPRPTPPSHNRSNWLREGSFYRDITTQAAGTLLAAIMAYVYAIAAGYVSRPTVLYGWVIPVAVLVLGCYYWALAFTWPKHRHRPLWVKILLWIPAC